MKLLVSLCNFYYWSKKFDIDAQLKYLDLIKDIGLDGVEIHISDKELEKEKLDLRYFAGLMCLQ